MSMVSELLLSTLVGQLPFSEGNFRVEGNMGTGK
jgi:hypothetical protein